MKNDKHQHLQALAKNQDMRDSHFVDKDISLCDLKTQFEIRAQRGQDKVERGLELLAKANRTDSNA